MTFLVESSAQADEDAGSVLEWMESQHAGDTGLRFYLALNDAISSLANFPQPCPLAPKNSELHFEVRQPLYGHL